MSFFNVGDSATDNVQSVIRKAAAKPGKAKAPGAAFAAGRDHDEAEFVKF